MGEAAEEEEEEALGAEAGALVWVVGALVGEAAVGAAEGASAANAVATAKAKRAKTIN